jgi:hypothetical protein
MLPPFERKKRKGKITICSNSLLISDLKCEAIFLKMFLDNQLATQRLQLQIQAIQAHSCIFIHY